MKFLIGKDLDSGVAAPPRAALGELRTGPTGLLSWLESQLGLALPAVSFTSRMVPYLNCLRAYDSVDAFYHASLSKDEFGVAATLLRWRDLLFEAGWDGGEFGTDVPRRLKQFAEVEQTALDSIAPGTGQRVQRVTEALGQADLEVTVELLDPADVFPGAWRRLFARLDATESTNQAQAACTDDSDLARLQQALLADRASGETARLAGDGTVVVLRDGSAQLSAPWIARYAHGQLGPEAGVAILAQARGSSLDDALTTAGQPALGFSDPSVWRPAFQVLPLALELTWEPLNPVVLLQFLTHPVGPLPRKMRRLLAEQVAAEPGIGGTGWKVAVSGAVEDAVRNVDKDEVDKRRAALIESVNAWLDCERADPATGVSPEALNARVAMVSGWLAKAMSAAEDESASNIFAAALGQSEELSRNLLRLQQAGVSKLSRDSARRLVEAVRGAGTTRPGRPWMCAEDEPQLLRAVRPAAFLEPVEQVIWWGCDEEHLPRSYAWSQSELAAIEAAGVELVSIDRQLEWLAASWLRPILAASKKLVLVLHDDAESHHPVFDEIVAVAEAGWKRASIASCAIRRCCPARRDCRKRQSSTKRRCRPPGAGGNWMTKSRYPNGKPSHSAAWRNSCLLHTSGCSTTTRGFDPAPWPNWMTVRA